MRDRNAALFEARFQILATVDDEALDRWIRRAATIGSVDDLFD
jgi:hypothetical protein